MIYRLAIQLFLICVVTICKTHAVDTSYCAKGPLIFSEKYPVDISFIIVDLKYNQERGVQICEIQQGSVSRFEGYDYLTEYGTVANIFTEMMSQFGKPIWFIRIDLADPKIPTYMKEAGYTQYFNQNELLADENFIAAASTPVKDPYSISDYHGIYIGRIPRLANSIESFYRLYPGIIPFEGSMCQFFKDKQGINQLLSEDELLKHHKPACGLFVKKYSPGLAQEILQTIGSEIVVIKPISAFKGNGVIIVDSSDLDSTLQYIFSNSSTLKKDKDPAYNWWGRDKNTHFIVEEFVPSDPVHVPHIENQPYDATMRVVCFLTLDKNEMSVQFMESYWKLPKKPLTAEGTLTEKHKSYATPPNYALVDDDVRIEVESQLETALLRLYHKILTKP